MNTQTSSHIATPRRARLTGNPKSTRRKSAYRFLLASVLVTLPGAPCLTPAIAAAEQPTLPATVENYRKAIKALNLYTGRMDKTLYKKVTPRFRALAITAHTEGAADTAVAQMLNKQIGRDCASWKKTSLDHAFGGILTADTEGWAKVDAQYKLPGSPAEVRAVVTTDVNSLDRIRNLDAYVIETVLNGGGPSDMQVLAGFGNLLAANNLALGEAGALGFDERHVTPHTTLLQLLKQGLDFGRDSLVEDRKAKLQHIIDLDLSKNLRNSLYARYEDKLDQALAQVRDGLYLWDSLRSYDVDPETQSVIINVIDPSSGQLEEMAGGPGRTAVIGDRTIGIDGSFVDNYVAALNDCREEWRALRCTISMLSNGASGKAEEDINNLDAPFKNPAYVRAWKSVEQQ